MGGNHRGFTRPTICRPHLSAANSRDTDYIKNSDNDVGPARRFEDSALIKANIMRVIGPIYFPAQKKPLDNVCPAEKTVTADRNINLSCCISISFAQTRSENCYDYCLT